MTLRSRLARLVAGPALDAARDRIAVLEARELILRAKLADTRIGLLVARAVHHDCIPRGEAIRLAHLAEQAELQRDLARNHAARVVSVCTCRGVGGAA